MRIIVDFADEFNDLEVIGLPDGTMPGQALGPRGEMAWRMFSAVARILFLVRQHSAVAEDALKRDLKFIEDRIRELRRG